MGILPPRPRRGRGREPGLPPRRARHPGPPAIRGHPRSVGGAAEAVAGLCGAVSRRDLAARAGFRFLGPFRPGRGKPRPERRAAQEGHLEAGGVPGAGSGSSAARHAPAERPPPARAQVR